MNIQEILDNLANLETELQNIKSARVMAEETIGSYKDTQKEIAQLTDGLGKVSASLVLLTKELKSQDAALSEKVREAVGKIDQELAAINSAFQESCDKTGASFNENAGKAIENIRQEMAAVSGAFEKGNAAFAGNLERLEALSDSITATSEQVKVIKASTDAFEKQLKSSCDRQNKAISEINANMGGIAEKLKEMEEREKAAEERLAKIESFIADDSDIRKSNYGTLQKSSKTIQVYLVIALLLLVFSIAYPFAKEFLKF